jgi:hypothetical protein
VRLYRTETLNTRASNFGSKFEVSEGVIKKMMTSGIVENILSWASFKQSKELKKQDGAKKTRLTAGSPLSACIKHAHQFPISVCGPTARQSHAGIEPRYQSSILLRLLHHTVVYYIILALHSSKSASPRLLVLFHAAAEATTTPPACIQAKR